MASLSDIQTQIEATIAGLTPVDTTPAPAYGESAFQQAAEHRDWENRPAGDIDRQFTVDEFSEGDVEFYSAATKEPVSATFSITIGHLKHGDMDKSRIRRDIDCTQIVRAIEDSDNYHADMCSVVRSSRVVSDLGDYWTTQITFDLLYLGTV